MKMTLQHSTCESVTTVTETPIISISPKTLTGLAVLSFDFPTFRLERPTLFPTESRTGASFLGEKY